MAQLRQAALNHWPLVLLRSSYRTFGGGERGGLQFSKLRWRRGVTARFGPMSMAQEEAFHHQCASPYCCASMHSVGFQHMEHIIPCADTNSHAQLCPTNPFCVVWGFSLFSVQTKSKLNVLSGRKGQRFTGERQTVKLVNRLAETIIRNNGNSNC